MIIDCSVKLSQTFSRVSDDFREFKSKGRTPAIEVVEKLKRLIENLSLIDNESVPQIDVVLTFTEDADPFEATNRGFLVDFVAKQTDTLCQLHLNIEQSRTSDSTRATLIEVQKKLDESYGRALSLWHKNKVKSEPVFPFHDLLGAVFPNGTPSPILTINVDGAHSPKITADRPVQISDIENDIFISEGAKQKYRTFNYQSSSKFQRFKTDILPCLSSSMIRDILSFTGEEGLINFCRHVSIFKPAQLRIVVGKFFSMGRERDILKLLTPRGIGYLEVCGNWPPELIQHWLNWLNADTRLNMSFIETIKILDNFWLKIKDFYPKIPALTPPARDCSFSSRLEEMLSLVESTEPAFKKIQIEFLFGLDWISLADYQTIKDKTQCLFICNQMLAEDVVFRAENALFDNSSEAVFYQYVSSHIQDRREASLQEIRQYTICAPNSIVPDVYWPWAAWCASSSQVMSKDHVLEIYQWLIKVSSSQQEEILVSLFAIPKIRRFPYKDFKQFLQLADQDGARLLKWINFYSQWQDKQEEGLSEAWQVLMKNLSMVNTPFLSDALSALGQELKCSTVAFKPAYFKALLLLFSDDHQELSPIDNLMPAFIALDPAQQSDILAVLSSYERKQCLLLNSLEPLMCDIAKGELLELVFKRYFQGNSFDYFKSAIDYSRIFTKMDELVISVQSTIDFFLSDEKILGVVQMKTYLALKSIQAFQEQNATLNLVRQEIKKQRAQKNNFDFSSLFANLKSLESFLSEFVKQELNAVFNMSSWAVTVLFSTGLIKTLDSSLSSSSTVQALMNAILNNHAKLGKVGSLQEFFKTDMLRIIVEPSTTPLLQRFLQKRLVDELVGEFETKIELQKLGVQPNQEVWRQYLHELPLEAVGIEQFFQRYQSMDYVLKAWPELEFQDYHDSQLFWDVISENQLDNSAPYTAAYWKIALKVIEKLINLQVENKIPRDLPIKRFLDAFFKDKASFVKIGLHGHGEIKHQHWASLMLWLSEKMPKYVKEPMFYNILPRAIEHILTYGDNFNFEAHLDIFAKMTRNPQLLPRLVDLLHKPDIKDTMNRLIDRLGEFSDKKDGRPWLSLIDKIFNAPDFEEYISEIEPILDWIQLPNQFPWVELIADDINYELIDLIQLKNTLQGSVENMWQVSHQKQYAPTVRLVVVELVDVPTPPPLTFWGRWVTPWFVRSDSVSPIADNASPPVDEEQQEIEITEEYAQCWKVWEQIPYPKVKQLNQWLSQEPSQIQQALINFDCSPLGVYISPYLLAEADVKRWIAELGFYEYMPPDKTKIEQRFKHTLSLINNYFKNSRTQLKKEFQEKCAQIRQETRLENEELQNSLIAIIAAIYCKATNKRPYPTQILTLLMMMEYHERNIIFEVDTGEGKGITTALMAVLKWSITSHASIEIRTATRDLVRQDFYEKGHWRFFKLLGIEHAIIQQDSPFESYNSEVGGIYYSTQYDMSVFYERRRQHGLSLIKPHVFVDEVDTILDQTGMINLAAPLAMESGANDYSWVYLAIHAFIEQMTAAADNSIHGFTQQLKKNIKTAHLDNTCRLSVIDKISDKQWKDWLILALVANRLVENVDFVIERFEQFGQKLHRTVPLVNGEIKHGFALSFQMDPELMPFLHARFHCQERRFVFEPRRQIFSQITVDFRDVHSFVGLSGFIGSLPELLDIIQSTNAVAMRISRHSPSKLQKRPDLLIDNTRALYASMLKMIKETDNPMWLVVEKIDDAKALYQALNSNDRKMFLLTGQEPEIERRHWLHQNGTAVFAGSPGSITISTLGFGRGTDIMVSPGYYLEIKQIDIFSPRVLAQLDGRTARGLNEGSRQRIYNKEFLTRQWGFIGMHDLPILSSTTLPCWIEKIQSHLMFQYRSQRKPLLIRGWLQYHLVGWLNDRLSHESTHKKFNPEQKHQYYLLLWQLLQNLSVSSKPEEILTKLSQKLILEGFSPEEQLKSSLLITSLDYSNGDWSRIVTQLGPNDDNVEPQIPRHFISEPALNQLRTTLNKKIGEKTYREEYSSLHQYTENCVNNAWIQFNEKPTFDNWSIFYQCLQSADEFYQQNRPKHAWQWGYWSWGSDPLHAWALVCHEVNFLLDQNIILPVQKVDFYQRLAQELKRKFREPVPMAGIWSRFIGWCQQLWKELMSFFNADMKSTLLSLNTCHQQFLDKPNRDNLISLYEKLKDATICFSSADQWRSMRPVYWWYWKNESLAWTALFNELPDLIEKHDQFAHEMHAWRQIQENTAHFNGLYREDLTNREQSAQDVSYPGIFSFWSNSSQQVLTVPQSKYEQERVKKDWQIKDLIAVKMPELCRRYPKEINIIHHFFNPDVDVSDGTDERASSYVKLLEVIHAFNDAGTFEKVPKLEEKFKKNPQGLGEKMRVLKSEIQGCSNSRELLPEWAQHTPTLQRR